jgi:polyphosphate glucokinase
VKILVIDVGGTSVKLLATKESEPRKFESGEHLTPDQLVAGVREHTADWKFDVVSLGYPGAVRPDGPTSEPGNLADGWVGYDFEKAFGKPVRLINDAAMQALGAYEGGRMLFLGLGTGLGSALVAEHVVVPLELGDLPWGRQQRTLFERLGRKGRKRFGKRKWLKTVGDATAILRRVFVADYVVLGGGQADEVEPMPPQTRRGGNEDAFTGGFRLWEEWVEPHDSEPPRTWRVVR